MRRFTSFYPVVVPTEGLEPPHPKAHGPEPCASTNSATWALMLLLRYCNNQNKLLQTKTPQSSKRSRRSDTIYTYCLHLLYTKYFAEILPVVVPTEGLEPPHPKAHGPEPCASTNSATWAVLRLLLTSRRRRQLLLSYKPLEFCARLTFVTLAPVQSLILGFFRTGLLPARKTEIIAEQFEKSKRPYKYLRRAAR